MITLGIDTTANTASCAVCITSAEEKVIAEISMNTKLTHSQTLIPMIEEVLKFSEKTVADIDRFAVSAGPGSFTGLRIGISAVKGITYGVEKKCVPVSTLEALAYNLRGNNGIVCAVMDARCNQVYNALFKVDGNNIERLCEDRALMISELAEEMSAYNETIHLVGDGAELVYKTINGENIMLAPPHLRFQRGSSVCFASTDKAEILPEQLMPVYLRLPQAERERIARENSESNKVS